MAMPKHVVSTLLLLSLFAVAHKVQARVLVDDLPAAFRPSDAEIEKAFADGEEARKAHKPPPVLHAGNAISVSGGVEKLGFVVAWIKPIESAWKAGYIYADSLNPSAAARKAAIAAVRTKILGSPQIEFEINSVTWTNPDLGGDNTPAVDFTLSDDSHSMLGTNSPGDINFCLGLDICTPTTVTFLLLKNAKPLLSSTAKHIIFATSVSFPNGKSGSASTSFDL